jgi:serine/threonine protein kinase
METLTRRLVSGTRLGRYRLERLLGTGGMASVWCARDERLRRSVAIKVLSETLALDRDFVRRFNREAKIAAGLSHPNLVKVFDFEAGDERPYLVSEYVAGGTLAQRLEAGGRPDAERLARELLSALAHIHAAGVVHRDVKPANVLLDREGRARLTDFGIAQPGDATNLTQPGQVIGTKGYMAPEVEAGDRASARSDLYSAGVVVEEVLSRSPAPGLVPLVRRLKAEDVWARPRSAQAALDELEGNHPREVRTAPTAVIATTPPGPTDVLPASGKEPSLGRRDQRTLAVLGILALAAISGLALSQGLGGGDGGGGAGRGEAAARGGGQAAEKPKPEEPASSPEPAQAATARPPTPTPAPAPAETPAADPCAAIEQQIGARAEDVKGLGHVDKEIRDALKDCRKSGD